MLQRALTVSGGGGINPYYGDFTPALNVWTEIDVGFVPQKVIVWHLLNNRTISVLEYDINLSKVYQWYDTYIKIDGTSDFLRCFDIQGTTVRYTPFNSAYISQTWIVVI